MNEKLPSLLECDLTKNITDVRELYDEHYQSSLDLVDERGDTTATILRYTQLLSRIFFIENAENQPAETWNVSYRAYHFASITAGLAGMSVDRLTLSNDFICDDESDLFVRLHEQTDDYLATNPTFCSLIDSYTPYITNGNDHFADGAKQIAALIAWQIERSYINQELEKTLAQDT